MINTPGYRLQQGLTLVELLVAMVLGLFLMAGTLQLFLGNNRIYRFQEGLSSVQENARAASEFLSRDIRAGGFTGCNHPPERIGNVLNNPSARWWTDFAAGAVIGYDGNATLPGQAFGTGAGERVAGTDAIVLLGAGRQSYSIVQNEATTDAQFKVDKLHHLQDGSIVMICDADHASIVQLTNVNASNVTMVHNTGTGTPGNCTKGLGLWTGRCTENVPCNEDKNVLCTANGIGYEYGPDSMMFDYIAIIYYIGNGETGRSLFRVSLEPGSAAPQAFELVEEVEDMQLHYGIDSDGDGQVDTGYRDASAVADWNQVLSVQVNLLLASRRDQLTQQPAWVVFPSADTGEANTAGGGFTASDHRVYRSFSKTIALRNRL